MLSVSSCGEQTGTENRSPIRLGDSATIVTEKDSQYLKDEVMDLTPSRTTIQADTASSKQEPAPVTAAPAVQEQSVPGQSISFGSSKMVLAGLETQETRKQNPEKEDGLTYSLRSGTLGASKLYFYGVKNVTVKQRYQSRLILKSDLGSVDLQNLGLFTSGWNTVPGVQNGATATFSLNGLNNMDYSEVNNTRIRNAADQELRKRRINSRTLQSWLKEIKAVRSAADEPCEIILDNVQWQVSGTDAQGKRFQKTIRIDA